MRDPGACDGKYDALRAARPATAKDGAGRRDGNSWNRGSRAAIAVLDRVGHGGRIQVIAYSTVQDVLSRRPDLWSAGQLRDLAHAIAGRRIDWQSGFVGEHAMFLDTMQRFYTDDGHGDGHLAFRGPEGLNVFDALMRFTGNGSDNPFAYDSLAAAVMPAANMVIASRKEMTDLYDEKLNEAMLRMETPLWQLPKGRTYDPQFVAEHANHLTKLGICLSP